MQIDAQAGDRKLPTFVHPVGRGEVDSDLRRKRGVDSTGRARLIEDADGRREYVRITAEQVKRYQPNRPPLETAERYARTGQPVVDPGHADRLISWGR